MPVHLNPTRRQVLTALALLSPAIQFLGSASAWATPDDDLFLKISRIITANDQLSVDISRRIHHLLADSVANFESKLSDLAAKFDGAGRNRDEILRSLTEKQVSFALDIAKPWYLGYVGTPSDFVLKDEAAFATFLEAQAWEKIVDEVPRPTYPQGNAGWWVVAPPGIDAPEMPGEITSWTFHPGGPSQILAPDPNWKSYATANHASIEDARRAKPAGSSTSG